MVIFPKINISCRGRERKEGERGKREREKRKREREKKEREGEEGRKEHCGNKPLATAGPSLKWADNTVEVDFITTLQCLQ